MLGLNRVRNTYTIRALYYKLKDVKDNVQQWEETPKVFRCNYSANKSIENAEQNQGVNAISASIITDSPIDFRINDKITINGVKFYVKNVTFTNVPISAQYTNKPKSFTKMIDLG